MRRTSLTTNETPLAIQLRRKVLCLFFAISSFASLLGCGHEGDDNEEQVQPVETRIAFASTRDGNMEIYTMNADGTNVVRLTHHLAWDSLPAWSPDGKKIAFTSNRDDGTGNIYTKNIYVINADGTDLVNLTNHSSGETSVFPCWSPDGKKMAFMSLRDDPAGDIYLMNADGTNPINLTNHLSFDKAPCWSPDGKKIVFASDREPEKRDEIYVMNSDGTHLINLTNHPALDTAPCYSPDGERIAFVSDRDNGTSDVYIMNADGTEPVRLTDHPAFDESPSWSPDGKKIVFVSDRERSIDVYVMDADGTNVVRLTKPESGDGHEPSWSPWLR